jgi:ABC-type polysaccharide/polyol phosphate export permease
MQTFVRDLQRQRVLVTQLAASDFRARFSGSALGFAWAFVQPLLTIAMYLFINRVGFRPMPLGNVPFVLWLITGIVPWFYFSDGIIAATGSLLDYSYLVKKVVFDVTIIPAIKLVSAAMTHVGVLAVVMVVVALSGFPPRLSWFQVPYYAFAIVALLSGLSLVTSSVTVFLRDLRQFVNVGIQFLFWLTPVAWSASNAPAGLGRYLKLNPIVYVVDGMRETLLTGGWFWQRPIYTAYFWIVTITLNVLGFALFQRLRPHFADVL